MNLVLSIEAPTNFIKILSLLIIIMMVSYPNQAYSSISNISVVKNNPWISDRDNLNISLKLEPQVPIIDHATKLYFEVRNLNDSTLIENLNTKVTLTDHDGRLYKFQNSLIPVLGGQFSVDYIFPDDGEHRIILQLYKNITPFTVSSFDLTIPHQVIQQSETEKLLNPFAAFFESLF
ncbi:hypothetical protein [Candidatus Nitrosocosmicus hydrocola]|uniref:hypothetical protein n=1 Tax=Candidatus Nitrosocosmicus hydrocola TaxID=1826872 RepID=UPI0011E5D865|nr:hypothetical protein [Candidatus Nitrosocosmicus hydrocola]